MTALDEQAARGSAVMALLAAAGEEGRARAIEMLEADIARFESPSPAIAAVLAKHRTDFGWRIAECRRAIEIIAERTTIPPAPTRLRVVLGPAGEDYLREWAA